MNRKPRSLVAKTQAEIEAVRKAVADRPHPRVLCVVDRVPGTIRDLYTATKRKLSGRTHQHRGRRIYRPAS